jgi:hypothetical protein
MNGADFWQQQQLEEQLQYQNWQADSQNQYQQHETKLKHEKDLKMNVNDMSFDQLVPSNSIYLSKDDVGEDGVILTVKGFKTETIKTDDGDEDKMVMYFEEDYKPMIVNRTNAQLIGIATGAQTVGEARGKQVIVYNDPTVGFGGKITGGIRIKKLAGSPKQAAKSMDVSDMESDTPF